MIPVSPDSGIPLRAVPPALRGFMRIAAHLRFGTLDLGLPDGRILRLEGLEPGPAAVLVLNAPNAFARRLALGGDVGFAESHIAGDWDSPDLTGLIELLALNRAAVEAAMPGGLAARLLGLLRALLNRNTRSRARRNASAHYDLGNAFYAAWLDPTMTYSAAMFGPGDDLEAAQIRKYRVLAEATGIAQDHQVLEIGCGWGGFAAFAAREIGCRVTALTVSAEQASHAAARVAAEGLADRVEIRRQDYRDARGTFDRVIAIEMIEAVGEAHWPAFFETLRDRLAPGGRAGLQAITVRDDLFPAYRREHGFIRRSVFPGGMLPSPAVLAELERGSGFARRSERVFGADYARTIAAWRERFRDAWPEIAGGRFDERFRRKWDYYLAYCEAGFRTGTIDVRQIVLERG
ncbi:SAM-dependent methyltransferase [Salinarimonas soli]|uniref:SAM-dependent methyltransferase n=1 Tax=Salinarimonas soli TaxID=1638099 RepID=UPI001F0B1206|nr:cyclopropane-fatty-acyl-phospholipid synthase family protein [Salinarimonas soli]